MLLPNNFKTPSRLFDWLLADNRPTLRNAPHVPIGTEKKTSSVPPPIPTHTTPLTMFEFDPTMCRGKDADGSQCICMRCTETHIVDNRALCVSCGHIESGHPVPEPPRPKVGSFIRGFQDAGRLGITPGSVKTSRADAEAETNAGLRKKRKSDTDTEPPSQPVKKAKGKEKEKVWLLLRFFLVSCH